MSKEILITRKNVNDLKMGDTVKFNKMDNTEKARELINKHLYLHGGDGLGITNGDVYRAVLDAVSEALTIPVVVGRSEQLICDTCKSGLINYPEINRRTCRCGRLGYNVTD